jgi:hypothetical protein
MAGRARVEAAVAVANNWLARDKQWISLIEHNIGGDQMTARCAAPNLPARVHSGRCGWPLCIAVLVVGSGGLRAIWCATMAAPPGQ